MVRCAARPGWFTETYCRAARYLHPENGAKGEAIREAIAAWPRTGTGKLRRMTPGERDLWEDLNRCGAGVVFADDPDHAAEMAARPTITGPTKDDDLPF